MPRRCLALAVALFLCSGVSTANAADPVKPLKVFILAGQSNMEGQAVADLQGKDYNEGKGTLNALLKDPAKANLVKHLKTASGEWAVRENVWVRYQLEKGPLKAGPLTLGFTPYGGRHHFGPELQFGNVLGDYVGGPVLLIKTAWGGKSLYKDFRPPSSGGEVGTYYAKMLEEVRTALADLKKDFPAYDGRPYELAGFVWYQGWNDGVDPKRAIPEYERNLVNLVNDVRKDLKAPDLPVVVGELTGAWVEAPPEWETLRKAQAAAANRPEFQGNVLFVPTHDFVRPAKESPNPGHGHHEFGNAETYFLVGNALGKGMVELLKARQKKDDPAPKKDEPAPKKDPPAPRKEKPELSKPTSHTTKTIEGWSVRVDDRLLAAPNEEMGARALRVLESRLADIKVVVPADKVKKLQAVTIVVDLSNGKLDSMQYHPSAAWLKDNGYSPDLARCVHIPRAEQELASKMLVSEQPWAVLHELAHSYHDQVLGFNEPRVKKAYDNYKASGHGDKVLHISGRKVKHYALTNEKEFFAEMTESYFGFNDFYPFNRAELKESEPEIYDLMETIWKGKAAPEGKSTPAPESKSTAAPVFPGLAGKHPLTEPQIGRLLIGELHCTACHARTDADLSLTRTAPNLADVGSRISPEYLRQFIASPSTTHAGTKMPDLLLNEKDGDRDRIAEAITHFLMAQSPHKFENKPAADTGGPTGKTVFHTVGCVACHSPRDGDGKETAPEGVVSLRHAPSKYSVSSLAEFLFQPTAVRPSGRMPDMKLTPAEARAVAAYLLGKEAKPALPLEPREELVSLGKTYFQKFNCTACHTLPGMPSPKPAAAMTELNPSRGCLGDRAGTSPQFSLSVPQKKAIRAALREKPEPLADKTRMALTLTAFNCIACHTRDDYGGVTEDLNPLFQTSEKELGDEARIPPPLTLVGAKLQPITLKKVLFDGDGVRPYMLTRMPQFGEPNLRHLPDLFARLDHVKTFEFSLPRREGGNKLERDREKDLRTAGRELVGDKGLSCVACHAVNGKAPNKKGIDLMTSYERLNPSWYYHFMINPSAFRPRTVMPTSWPGGQAVHKTILNGDTDQQLTAIWFYLSLGTSAPDPPGVQPTETLLTVTDATRTYRGRSSVAGFRGIAVGYPEKLNYAFNAETGTLSAIWRGEFVKVDRSGQGSGAFRPAGPFVGLAQDLSFFDLKDEKAAWPLRPVMTKEAPVNPDPLYPKNCGYQFKGYYMDEKEVPTFMYTSGGVAIEDRSIAKADGRKLKLVRTVSFDAPGDQALWFRALTGKVQAVSSEQFQIPGLQLSVPAVPTLVRPLQADKNGSEVLLKITIPKGKSDIKLTYELLP
jgi:mono/diheme cytochrome c family protein